MKSFVYDICSYTASQIPSSFTFGTGNTNLKASELVRGTEGVFAVDSGPEAPDPESALEYHNIDFWAVNTDTETAKEQLLSIYNLFHQAHHYNTASYTVQFSHALSHIVDMDRDFEGRRMMKLTVRFIGTVIIS